jgi:glyoxylase-like metal-dependent hydrolase (beta-lactamase superfamily II)
MSTELSRRHFLRTSAVATAATLAATRFLRAQIPDRVLQAREEALKTPITTTKLYDNVFLLQGAGGNMALQTGKDGQVLIDSSFATAVPAILEAIKKTGPGTPDALINTHWHYDHTDGNENLHAAGYTIFAHENTRKRLSTPQTIKAFNLAFPANPAGALPTITFDSSLQAWHNGDTLDLVHFDPAHTDTDIYIHFQKANVLHCGDTFFNGFYPFIDESSGGSIGGMIRANEKALALATADTKIIPGHGPLGTKADLLALHDMLSGVREKVAALKSAGLTEQEAIAKKPTAQWDAKWAGGMMNGDAFTGLAYRTV